MLTTMTVHETYVHKQTLFVSPKILVTFSLRTQRQIYIPKGIRISHTDEIIATLKSYCDNINRIPCILSAVITDSPKNFGTVRSMRKIGSMNRA